MKRTKLADFTRRRNFAKYRLRGILKQLESLWNSSEISKRERRQIQTSLTEMQAVELFWDSATKKAREENGVC